MTTVYKILGQSAPTANTLTTVYTVPVGNSAVISTIAIANRSATNTSYRIAIQQSGNAISNAHYIAFDTIVYGYDTTALTLGITLAANDVISANIAGTGGSINIFGSEIY